uniref:Uncharacterized protein n=1 Tax=Anopheles dirus TaxID=7168 RepID=A0A182NYW9_9DIPT
MRFPQPAQSLAKPVAATRFGVDETADGIVVGGALGVTVVCPMVADTLPEWTVRFGCTLIVWSLIDSTGRRSSNLYFY